MINNEIILKIMVLLALFTVIGCSAQNNNGGNPVNIIFDTDMATDCDDAGAMAMLHALERKGEANILATVANNRGDHSAGMIAAINAFYGRPGIPVGAYQGDAVGTDPREFFAEIAMDTDQYGHTAASRDQLPNAVEVYRQSLAEAGSNEVVIVSVGHLNNLYDLLQSGPDQHSTLNGMQLVEQKVARLVVMGGYYPSGKEHNFAARGSAQFTGPALEQWPTRVLLSGYELGENVMTGPALAELEETHPVYRAYTDHPSNPLVNGRQSWDQTAVLAAVRDPELYWDLSAPGQVMVDSDGNNSWANDPDGSHVYLIERENPGPSEVAQIIEELMTDMP
ncbi:MAG: nucleoside hydrolase [Balneolales bacterium]